MPEHAVDLPFCFSASLGREQKIYGKNRDYDNDHPHCSRYIAGMLKYRQEADDWHEELELYKWQQSSHQRAG